MREMEQFAKLSLFFFLHQSKTSEEQSGAISHTCVSGLINALVLHVSIKLKRINTRREINYFNKQLFYVVFPNNHSHVTDTLLFFHM